MSDMVPTPITRVRKVTRLWTVVINPDDYDDADDIGYGTTVEARTEASAVNKARRECEADNGWERGRLNEDNCQTWEAQGSSREALRKTLAAYDAAAIPERLRAHLLRVAMGSALDGWVSEFVA